MIIIPEAGSYSGIWSTPETELLRELRETTQKEMEHDDMLSGPVVGNFLQMLVRISGARRILEVGTFTGYATLWMAMGMPPGGQIRSCDMNEKYTRVARKYFNRYREEGGQAEIDILFGPALETIRKLVLSGEEGSPDSESAGGRSRDSESAGGRSRESESSGGRSNDSESADSRSADPAGSTGAEGNKFSPLDFVFLDADKEHYPDYYEMLVPALRPGGIMVVDNAFWDGKVWEQIDGMDKTGPLPEPDDGRIEPQTIAIHRLNRRIAEDDRVQNVLLTVRDGLHVVRKRDDAG